MFKYLIIPFVGLAVLVAARLSLYTVDAAEYAYVTVLGRPSEIFDGGGDGAGLKLGFPWPIQQVQRLDRRLQQFDLPAVEQLTHDPDGNTIDKILLIEAYVCWKIADAEKVDDFVKSIGSIDRAKAFLSPRINSQLGAEIGQMRMDDLVNIPNADAAMEKLHKRLLDSLREPIRKAYGIDLVDIRLRRFNHPASVRDSIFNRIRSERNKKATEYKSEGELQASKIGSEAEEKVRETLANARSKEEAIKADADIQANKIRNEAFSQDREFYAFLRKMEDLQSILGSQKTMLLLSTYRPMFESMFKEPRPTANTPQKDKKGDK